LLAQWHKTRKALSEDDDAAWKPLLDKYSISVVLIEPEGARLTYRRLMKSKKWVPFYDDGRIVMFGRADAPKPEVAFFNANRLDPDLRAFRTHHPVVGAERPPNPTSWIDDVFQTKTFSRLQSRTESSRRWLAGPPPDTPLPSDASQPIPEPARCLLGIQEARTALARSPDDWVAYRLLKDAYRFLMVQEAAMLAGIPIKPQNVERIRSVSPRLEHLMNRYQQRMTALNYAIQTTPSPRSRAARLELNDLNLELFQLYLAGNARDLARDRLKILLESSELGDYSSEMRLQLQRQLDQLNQESKQLEDRLQDLQIEQSAGPIDQASFALAQGGVGVAIAQLADAERNSMSPAVVKPRLIDMYCNTGQPDRALELLSVGAIDDPNLGSEPGAAALRQGRVYFLLGNYFSASTLWQTHAIPRARQDRSTRVLAAAGVLTRGEATQSTNDFLSLPASLTQQATWEYDLAMCQLEAGTPDEAAVHFTQALTLAPDLHVRPIAAYYLEKLGKPVPPPLKREPGTTKPDGSGVTVPLDPGSLPVPTDRPVLPVTSPTRAAAPTQAGDSSAQPPKTPAPASGGTEESATKKPR
jgi:tetratricopeptide (TPR) repeat protein